MIGAVRDRAIDSGVLAKLSPEQPTIFGPVKGAVFSGVPRAKIVGEGEVKPSASVDVSAFYCAAYQGCDSAACLGRVYVG